MPRFTLPILLLSTLLLTPAHADKLEQASAFISKGDYDQAIALLRPEARSSNTEAWYLLGNAYAGKDQGKKAARWLEKAANAGNYDAATQLGKMYASGHGVDLDPNQAAHWFQKASEIAEAEGEEEDDCE